MIWVVTFACYICLTYYQFKSYRTCCKHW